jgi:DNA polymerase III subunit epsilon
MADMPTLFTPLQLEPGPVRRPEPEATPQPAPEPQRDPADGLIVFDVETTGTDRRLDQVIELCVQFGLGEDATSRTWRFRPSVPISPGAQAVHGISMADLAECPPFAALADEVRAIFERARVLVGYNLAFDIDMLQAEYERLRQPRLPVDDKHVVDAFRLWQQCEPRSLMDAHRRFVGEEFGEAHTASADVAATGRVLAGMLQHFGLDSRGWSEVAEVCEPERARWIGPSRHVAWCAETGAPVINFGKHSGTSLSDLARTDNGGYLRWILGKDFPPHVRDICARCLECSPDEFLAWLEDTYGPRQPQADSAGKPDRKVA